MESPCDQLELPSASQSGRVQIRALNHLLKKGAALTRTSCPWEKVSKLDKALMECEAEIDGGVDHVKTKKE